jgi:hypothetical protein
VKKHAVGGCFFREGDPSPLFTARRSIPLLRFEYDFWHVQLADSLGWQRKAAPPVAGLKRRIDLEMIEIANDFGWVLL